MRKREPGGGGVYTRPRHRQRARAAPAPRPAAATSSAAVAAQGTQADDACRRPVASVGGGQGEGPVPTRHRRTTLASRAGIPAHVEGAAGGHRDQGRGRPFGGAGHLTAARPDPAGCDRRGRDAGRPVRQAADHLRRLHRVGPFARLRRRLHPRARPAPLRQHPHRELRHRTADHPAARGGPTTDPRRGRRHRRRPGFSAASNVTGVLSDADRIAALLHEHGALSFWDYAAAGPYVPIRMRESATGRGDHKNAVSCLRTSSSAAPRRRGSSWCAGRWSAMRSRPRWAAAP